MDVNKKELYALAKDMKYEALYWALKFEEKEEGVFYKQYENTSVIIDSNKQCVYFDGITIVNQKRLTLNSHKDFVILEVIDRLLRMGYSKSSIIIDLNNEYDIYCQNLYIKCYEWGHLQKEFIEMNTDNVYQINYESRLLSGVIENNYLIKVKNLDICNHGIFELEDKVEHYSLYNTNDFRNNGFIIEGGILKKCLLNTNVINIPEGVRSLSSSLFWDNQVIEEVNLPNSLVNIGGDTFYNCKNLKRVNIPINVKYIGNNPFAGCPNMILRNESKYLNYEHGALYTKDYSRLIYYSIKNTDTKYEIHEKTKIIGKHAFYLCENLKELVIPKNVIKLENNPFSGCSNLNIINYSERYRIEDKVIYDSKFKSVIGCLQSIDTDCLILKNVEKICRNSFWECRNIRKIVLPETLKIIGYNPFVGCSNIEFECKSTDFTIYKGALYTKNKDKLICYPAKFAKGCITLPDETIVLERGAFSGANCLKNINLHNVSIINKNCFTNCNSLTDVYCSDFVSYIGEWSFGHCKNLKNLSVYKDCLVDNNVLLNTNATLEIRKDRTNYLIESDNIYTLETFKNSLIKKVKSILIDPPYNTHVKGIGYKDSFDNNYIKFIEDRINISYNLLTDDGFLVINIDKGELKNIKKICNKYFGKLVRVYKWEKLHQFFDVNRSVDSKKKKIKYEYIIICRKEKTAKLNDIKQPFIVGDELKEIDSKVPKKFSCFGTNSSAKDEINEIFGNRYIFRTPKPLKLIKELLRATSNKESLVMDFFAGSGTLGEALMNLNNEDNGNRKFILISNNESNICRDITYVRLKKCADNYNNTFIFLKDDN